MAIKFSPLLSQRFRQAEANRCLRSYTRTFPGYFPASSAWDQALLPALYRLIYTCGLRPNEGRELLAENIHLETGEILITHTKRNKERIVVMSDDMLIFARKYEQRRRLFCCENPYFFPSANGGGWQLVNGPEKSRQLHVSKKVSSCPAFKRGIFFWQDICFFSNSTQVSCKLPHGCNPLGSIVAGNHSIINPVENKFAGQFCLCWMLFHAPAIKFYEMPEVGFSFITTCGAIVR